MIYAMIMSVVNFFLFISDLCNDNVSS